MSIPKSIHYCWFGRNPLPELAVKCIKSWEKYCPDYTITEWNEDNFDITSCPLYVRQAYEAKKWAFVTDYVRLRVIYDHGGIYFDTDVELKKNIDSLLMHKAFFGFENGKHIATGLGFGAEKGTQIVAEMMRDYDDILFLRSNGGYDTTSCPKRNTDIFLRHGLVQDDSLQILEDDILILPKIYLCPIDYSTMRMHHSFRTVSIHWFAASWHSSEQRQEMRARQRANRKKKLFRWLRYLIGENLYERLRLLIKGNM